MKRIICVFLTFALLCGIMPAAFATNSKEKQAALNLYSLGLFQGTGVNTDGTPIFDLDRAPTRSEAVTMLVRLLGKETEAKTGNWNNPFIDVDNWAKPYVGYAYANGLTNGIGGNTFGGNYLVSASQYLTFILRALGYSSESDFKWNSAVEFSNGIGLTNGEYYDNSRFFRGDVARVSYNALSICLKNSERTLANALIDSGVFTQASYSACADTYNAYDSSDMQEEFEIETIHYKWDWLFWTWSYDLAIPVQAVEYYEGLERNPYSSLTGFSSYVSDPIDDSYLSSLANMFVNTVEEEGYGKDAAVEMAICFVQNLDYLSDDDYGYEYPKYPLETLYDCGGDCEDTSILLVSLIREMGYGCCLIQFDDHMGVGVLGTDDIDGCYFEFDGNKYFYVETTDKDWEIGEMPEDYFYKTAHIWPF